MLRVFVIDDSLFIRKALTRIVATRPDMRIVGMASSGAEALERIPVAKPHVVTLDVEMPGMNGLATLKELMRRYPGLPVIMLSQHTHEGAKTTIEAMANGAVDFIDKSNFNVMDLDTLSSEFLGKIAVWKASNRAYDWATGKAGERISRLMPRLTPTLAMAAMSVSLPHLDWSRYELCVLGASTGGPAAIQAIVEHLTPDFPVPIAIVQHMPVGFTRPFAERLNGLGHIRVKEAVDRDHLVPGTVLIAPAGQHLTIDEELRVHLNREPKDAKHMPSVDVMMLSAAKHRPHRVVGVLLTGMGADGAEGMRAIHVNGGLTIAESESSCVVYGMPNAAHKRGGVSHLLPLPEICKQFARGNTQG